MFPFFLLPWPAKEPYCMSTSLSASSGAAKSSSSSSSSSATGCAFAAATKSICFPRVRRPPWMMLLLSISARSSSSSSSSVGTSRLASSSLGVAIVKDCNWGIRTSLKKKNVLALEKILNYYGAGAKARRIKSRAGGRTNPPHFNFVIVRSLSFSLLGGDLLDGLALSLVDSFVALGGSRLVGDVARHFFDGVR
jgi:hypothetical protein